MPMLRRNAPLTRPMQPMVIIKPCISGNQTMLIAFLYETIGRYFRYRTQLASINELDDRTLNDIGLNRGELRSTAWHLVDREAWQ